MAQSGVTTTGLVEMIRMIDAFPAAEQEALRRAAESAAHREMETARSLVPVDQGITRESISITADVPNHQYLITVGPTPHAGRRGHWATFVADFLAILIEYGTSKMLARPFMRPASDQERDRYTSELKAVSISEAKRIFKA